MLFGDVAAGGVFQRAEILAERHLLFVGEGLCGEHEDGVAIHPGLDRGDAGRVERLGQVDPGDAAGQGRANLFDCDGHLAAPS